MKFYKLELESKKYPGHIELPDRNALRKFFSLVWALLRTEGEPLEQMEQVLRGAKSSFEIERGYAQIAPYVYSALEYLTLTDDTENPFSKIANDLSSISREYTYIRCEGKLRVSTKPREITYSPFEYCLFSSHFDCDALSFFLVLNGVNVSLALSDYLSFETSRSSFCLSCELACEDGRYECDMFELLSAIERFFCQSFDVRTALDVLKKGFHYTKPSIPWMIFDEIGICYTLTVQIENAILSDCNNTTLFLLPIQKKQQMYRRPIVRIIVERVSQGTNKDGDEVFQTIPFIGSERMYIATLFSDVLEYFRSFVSLS